MKALILTGDGINCEKETAYACELAGFTSEIRHINDLIDDPVSQTQLEAQYSLLVIPGGFSFGDELGSGRVLALKISRGLGWDLKAFAERGKLVLGICNGFQALIQLKVFGEDLSITHNSSGRFINQWVRLKVQNSDQNPERNPWTQDLDLIDLPIRHGEGRLVTLHTPIQSKDRTPAFRYSEDINGSLDQTAGLTTSRGRILGLMPHPEAFVRKSQYPNDQAPETLGLALFQNAFQYLDQYLKEQTR